MSFPMHAHITREVQDCDGRYVISHTGVNEDEVDDLEFQHQVTADVIETGVYATLRVSPNELDWYQPTEEGYVHVVVRWCEYPKCRDSGREFRDPTAESMGW